MAPRKASELKVLKTTDSYEIIGNEQGGFAVIAADDLLPEVLGVSTSNYSDGQNTNFLLVMGAIFLAQFVFVTFGGAPLHVEPLSVQTWLVCLGLAFL